MKDADILALLRKKFGGKYQFSMVHTAASSVWRCTYRGRSRFIPHRDIVKVKS